MPCLLRTTYGRHDNIDERTKCFTSRNNDRSTSWLLPALVFFTLVTLPKVIDHENSTKSACHLTRCAGVRSWQRSDPGLGYGRLPQSARRHAQRRAQCASHPGQFWKYEQHRSESSSI